MGIRDDVSADPRGSLFAVLNDVRAGMLGLRGGGEGFQPMTHFPDADRGLIWFISSTETSFVQSLGLGEDAEYVVISDDHDVHASLRGKLYHVHDDAQLDALWNPVIAAFFEGRRDDPKIALLRFDCDVADMWASSSSTLKFCFEILRASLDSTHQPDLGVRATVTFRETAA